MYYPDPDKTAAPMRTGPAAAAGPWEGELPCELAAETEGAVWGWGEGGGVVVPVALRVATGECRAEDFKGF